MSQSIEVGDGHYLVPMSILIDYIGNPFESEDSWVWDCPAFTAEDVLSVSQEDEISSPYDDNVQNLVVGQASYHIGRIAYLIRHDDWVGAIGDDERYVPVLEFPVGYEYNLSHPLLDGNHRFAAAILRGDEFFMVSVDGDIDAAEELFGIETS